VKIGIPPGAGGTQRLPRLVGVPKALEMIVTGDPIKASEGAAIGLIDRLSEGDLVADACAFLEERLQASASHPRTGDRKPAAFDRGVFDAMRRRIEKRARGQRAPYACIECVEAAAALGFDAGIERERRIFEECVGSVEARALRHAFFAERAVAKVPGVGKETPTLPIERAGVIGAGTMGRGIAMNFANAGIPVILNDTSEELLARARGAIEHTYAATVAKGRMSDVEMRARMGLITPCGDIAAVADADIVIEAVFEEMPIKLAVFKELDGLCKASTILASNTSYLDVNVIARATRRPQKVLGTHFFSPANVMRLLEIVRTATCSPETLATVVALARRMQKVGVVAGVCHGFIGNRMLEGYLGEAAFLIEDGASPAQVDKVMTDFGMAMGPFAVSDLAGLDIGWRKRKANEATRDRNVRYAGRVADKLCERGRYGQKTGGGFYRYEGSDRTPRPDPEVEALIAETSRELGIERREIDETEILSRCLYPLINEGMKILEEGIALRSGDIDIVWLNGYGFPAWRGGPMFYGETVGLDRVLEAVQGNDPGRGSWWIPSALLERFATSGESLENYGATPA
jgi:3-hydroxyacyl-CoA dehydrogenase